MQPTAYVAYYRVSTQQQGMSGLGLEAQQSAVRGFCKQPIIAEFMEVESGRKDNRPQLEAALAHAKQHGATLVIAKLDRLARSVAFIQRLLDGKVPFVCVDMPEANKVMLQISAVFAEHEADQISKRTKAALAAAKARGVQLGGCRGEARTRADAHAASVAPHIQRMLANGPVRASVIARELNALGVPTAGGKEWQSGQVLRLIARMDGATLQE